MSDSIVFYHGRDDALHIIDPDGLPHFDELPPLFELVVAVINAGYKGVVVDEKQLANGRFFLGLSVDQGTPEGQIIQALAVHDCKRLPSIELVLKQIENKYALNGGNYE
jgi:hypothetical protein